MYNNFLCFFVSFIFLNALKFCLQVVLEVLINSSLRKKCHVIPYFPIISVYVQPLENNLCIPMIMRTYHP